MSNEELASLEPIIAQAWDHWDQQVSVCVHDLAVNVNNRKMSSGRCTLHMMLPVCPNLLMI